MLSFTGVISLIKSWRAQYFRSRPESGIWMIRGSMGRIKPPVGAVGKRSVGLDRDSW
jgi:hypothetical protein